MCNLLYSSDILHFDSVLLCENLYYLAMQNNATHIYDIKIFVRMFMFFILLMKLFFSDITCCFDVYGNKIYFHLFKW
jgi:hypothetical protein